MIEWTSYANGVVAIRMPKGLRKSAAKQWRAKRSALVFRGRVRESDSGSELIIGLDPDVDPVLVDASRRMLDEQVVDAMSRMAETTRRYTGPSVTRPGGTELKATEKNGQHSWTIIFPIETRWIQIDLVSPPSSLVWPEFEEIGTQIITSMRLVRPVGSATGSPGSKGRGARKKVDGGLLPKDKARLAAALVELPETLRYLQESILMIAIQDQDLLGSGAVDTTQLAVALEQQAASRQEGFALIDAEALANWLHDEVRPDGDWTAPIRFVQAFLTGHATFGASVGTKSQGWGEESILPL